MLLMNLYSYTKKDFFFRNQQFEWGHVPPYLCTGFTLEPKLLPRCHNLDMTTILHSLLQRRSPPVVFSPVIMPPSFSFLFIFGHQIINNFSLLVPQSKPHVRPSPLLVHRHGMVLLDLHLAIDHSLRAPHLRTTSQETCCTTQLTPWLFHKLNPRCESR